MNNWLTAGRDRVLVDQTLFDRRWSLLSHVCLRHGPCCLLVCLWLAIAAPTSSLQAECVMCDQNYWDVYCNGHTSEQDSRPPLSRFKKSFFQLWETETAWVGTDEDLKFVEVNNALRVAMPLDGTTDNVLALQPGLRTYFLDGPESIDVPSTLYDAQLSVVWRKKWSERWQSNVWTQPKVRSDFQASHDDSFFFSGGAYAKYAWNPGILDIYLGAFFLDRDDVSFLPGVGLVYTPVPDLRYEILLPRPKIAYRVQRFGDTMEKWAYLSGQLGGGSFAVLRDAGNEDKVTLSDLRLFLGVETVKEGGGGLFLEFGYVFNRSIEYKKSKEEIDFGDSLMFRAGMRI